MPKWNEMRNNFEEIPFGIAYYEFENNVMDEMTEEDWSEAFLFANSAFYECIGQSAEKFEEKSCHLPWTAAWGDRKRFEHLIEDTLSGQEDVHSDVIHIMNDEGYAAHVQWNCRYIVPDNGKAGVVFNCMSVERFNKEEIEFQNRLRQSERERKDLKNIIFEIPVGIASVRGGNELQIDEVNREFCKITGRGLSDFSVNTITMAQIIHAEDYMLFEDAVEVSRKNKQSGDFEARIVTADNKTVWAVFQCQIYCYRSAVPYYLISCWEITERKKLENEMMLANERYHLLEEVSDGTLMEYDVPNRRFVVSEDCRQCIGNPSEKYVAEEEICGYIHPGDLERVRRVLETASRREMQGSIEYRLKRGEYRYYRTTYRSVTDYDGKICRIIGRNYDISEERKIREELQKEVRLDPLTRILNKTASRETVDKFLTENPEGMHVLYVIDIDDFKRINDTFGHTVGDMVISDIAMLIQQQFLEQDIVGRVGGDEFIVLAKNTSMEKAREKAQKLCENVRKRISGDGAEIVVTLSVGVSVAGQDGADYNDLFERADQAMYHIKKNGKNHFIFAKEMKEIVFDGKNHPKKKELRKNPVTDKAFLNTAFSLLSHARDINGSLNVLLEQIGKKYHMNLVSVFEYEPDGENMLLTNYWSDMGKIYESNILPITWPKLQRAETGEFVHTSTGWQKKRPDEWKKWSGNGVPIRAIAAVKFEYSNGKTGCIDVGSVDGDKQWNTEETGTICELSRIVAVFVTLRNAMREDQQVIHKLKNRDKLTGLYNLEAFRKKTRRILESENVDKEKVYALIMIDINNFSYINENFGPQIGDSILKELADLILKKQPLAACRMYSDYFLVFCCGRTQREIKNNVKNANEEFEKEFQKRYPSGCLNLSAGICFDADKKSFDTIFESANLARKYAKEHSIISGTAYREEMRKSRDEQVLIATRFYGAIQRGEFEMFLQPKFKLGENEIYGAEALARWRIGKEGYLQPGQFIPALENMGYIMDLDFYIFEQLLKYLTKWKEAGKKLFTVSTNFSRRNFEGGGEIFLQRIKNILKKYKIHPSYVEIEVTESVVVEDMDNLKRCLGELADIGFRIAIDDFGTGYSSLSVLYEIPANVIKIDKSFTDKVALEGRGEFVSKMGQLIRSAKEEIVVEGIETEEQRRFLENCGFKYGQGYLFDRPLPADEFERKYVR